MENHYVDIGGDMDTKNDGLIESIEHHGMGRDMKEAVCIDIDGVLADFYNCKERCDYSCYPHNANDMKRDKCPVVHRARKALRALRRAGVSIILQTGRIISEREVTMKWLAQNDFPYDLLIMGKPRAVVYIDDFGYRFQNWDDTIDAIKKRIPHMADEINRFYEDD